MALNDGEHKLQNNKKTQHALCNFLVGEAFGTEFATFCL